MPEPTEADKIIFAVRQNAEGKHGVQIETEDYKEAVFALHLAKNAIDMFFAQLEMKKRQTQLIVTPNASNVLERIRG